MTPQQRTFTAWLGQHGLPEPLFEFHFHPKRMWRFDAAWPGHMIALEIDGGIWTNGRHVRGKGFLGDIEKMNQAAVLGWRVLRVTPDQLFSQNTIDMLVDVVGREPKEAA